MWHACLMSGVHLVSVERPFNSRFRDNVLVFESNRQGRDCQQAVVQVAWSLLRAVRNASEAEMVAKQELVCGNELISVQ